MDFKTETQLRQELAEMWNLLRAERDGYAALLPGSHYMDPPDGGSVTVFEQLQRMAKDAERFRKIEHDFSPMGLDANGNHPWAYRRNFSLRGPTLAAAIDAAPVLGAA